MFPLMRLPLVLVACCFTVITSAQQAAVATGGEAGGTGTLSYSVGQPAYTTVSAPGGTLQQGVQQPYAVLPTSLATDTEGKLLLTAFPNPASHLITVHANTILSPDASAQVVAADGKLVLQQRLTGVDSQLDLQALAAGSYTLRVLDHDRLLGSFTILKR